MARTCVFAGSFDPVTVGHLDIIRRAAKLCDRLLVTVMYNPAKQGCFTVEERLDFLARATEDISGVEVDAWDGLMVDYVRKMGADFVVRGVRGAGDLESESNLAQINRYLMPELETVFLPTRPELACVSSSAVREAALFGADFSAFVPVCILADVKHHFDK
jgi:pantetheine-phosphate adenylyltransferase